MEPWEQKYQELTQRQNAAARAYRQQNAAIIKLLGLTEQHLQHVLRSIQELKLQLATGQAPPTPSEPSSPQSGPAASPAAPSNATSGPQASSPRTAPPSPPPRRS